MKRLLLALCGLLLAFPSFAGVSVELREATIPLFLSTVFRGVLSRDYVIGSDVPADKKLSLYVKDLEPKQAAELAVEVLRSQGLTVEEKNGVFFIGKASEKPAILEPAPSETKPPEVAPLALEWVVYRPRHRQSAFLREIALAAGARVSGLSQGIPVSPGFPGFPTLNAGNPIPQGFPQYSHQGAASGALVGASNQQAPSAPDLIVFGVPEDRKDKVMALLESVDIPQPAVSIRAVLLEVSDLDDKSRSINAVLSLLSGKLGLQLSAGALAANSISFKNASIDALLTAVDGDSRFKYLAEPRLQVISGETATLTVGSDVPVRGAVSLDQSGHAIQSVEYRTGGLTLAVTPQVFRDAVVIKIDQQVSSFANTTTSTIDSPTLLKRKLTTSIRTGDGDMVMLAGLDENRESSSGSGVSFLPRFLRSVSETKARSQLVLLMEVKREPLPSI